MEILDNRKQSNIYKQKAYPLISEVTSKGNALQTHEFEGGTLYAEFLERSNAKHSKKFLAGIFVPSISG